MRSASLNGFAADIIPCRFLVQRVQHQTLTVGCQDLFRLEEVALPIFIVLLLFDQQVNRVQVRLVTASAEGGMPFWPRSARTAKKKTIWDISRRCLRPALPVSPPSGCSLANFARNWKQI